MKMSNVDWNKAPVGATHYAVDMAAFYMMCNDVLLIHDDHVGWLESQYKDIPDLSEEYDVIERPKQLVADTPKKHIHHDLIVQWAADTSQKVWAKNLCGNWIAADHMPIWNSNLDYYIGDNPPRATIRIGEFDVPKPLASHELIEGNVYHSPLVHLAGKASGKLYYLNVMGYCSNLHLTKEDALLHSEALRSLTP
jgi:hypothetical protein